MGADEDERVPADPPASGERADRKLSVPGVEMPDTPDTKRLTQEEVNSIAEDDDDESDDDE